LAYRLFNSFDNDVSGELDFLEFSLYVCNFCSFTGESLVLYTFTLYGQGMKITFQQLKSLMKDIYGDSFEINQDAQEVMKALAKVMATTTDMHGYINDKGLTLKAYYSFDDFKEFTRHHQVALFPLFSMQDAFKKALSSINWKKHSVDKGEFTTLNIEDVVKNMKGYIIIIIINIIYYHHYQ